MVSVVLVEFVVVACLLFFDGSGCCCDGVSGTCLFFGGGRGCNGRCRGSSLGVAGVLHSSLGCVCILVLFNKVESRADGLKVSMSILLVLSLSWSVWS